MANVKGGKKEARVERVEAEAKKRFPIDAKTHRRLLRFLNAAHTPEDIANGPDIQLHLHVEYRKR
jgi:hypothetical protein